MCVCVRVRARVCLEMMMCRWTEGEFVEGRAGELNDLKGLMAGCAWEKQPYVRAAECHSVLEDE